jgi:hypothetical protein
MIDSILAIISLVLGDAPAGAPKGFALALWKPSQRLLSIYFVKLYRYLISYFQAVLGDAPVGAPKGFALALWKPSHACQTI